MAVHVVLHNFGRRQHVRETRFRVLDGIDIHPNRSFNSLVLEFFFGITCSGQVPRYIHEAYSLTEFS
jgi:hypothetical protein